MAKGEPPMETPFYRSYLRDELSRRCARNPGYSLRAFSRALALDCSTLSRTLSGKRRLSVRVAQRILRKLAMSPEEKSRFIASLLDEIRERDLASEESGELPPL